jgi:hypothetical protein
LAAAVARLLLAFVVVAGIVHSGARYFYCEAVGLAATDPCVQSSRAGAERCREGALRELRDDCCEVVTLPSIPNGARTEGPIVPPAAVGAVVAVDRHLGAFDGGIITSQALALARWRTPPRSVQRVHAQLMVFLT